MLGSRYDDQYCAMARALEVVGERWTLLIVRDAFYGVRRFSELAEHLDVPRAVLSDRLRSLTEAGVLDRLPDPDHAGRTLYELTPLGRGLWPTVHALSRWGRHFAADADLSRVFEHAACGTELDDRGRCPRCDLDVPPDAVITRRTTTAGGRDDAVAVALRGPHRLLEPVTS